jgi:hypothetical protein
MTELLEKIKPILPATFAKISFHFPDHSPRGLRNKINLLVEENKLFRYPNPNGKRGTPEYIYSLEAPPPNKYSQELLKLHSEFADAIRLENRDKLILIYKKLGDFLLHNT